jgi:hypothetical protein
MRSNFRHIGRGARRVGSAEKMVAFFAKRDNVDYYVEIGVIK